MSSWLDVLMRTGEFREGHVVVGQGAPRVSTRRACSFRPSSTPRPGTGAYSPAQLTDAAIIRILREVGVSLQDIHEVLEARDLGFVRKVLAEQAERFQVGLDAVSRIIGVTCTSMTTRIPGASCSVGRPTHIVLAIQDAPLIADLGTFLRRSERTLREAATTPVP